MGKRTATPLDHGMDEKRAPERFRYGARSRLFPESGQLQLS